MPAGPKYQEVLGRWRLYLMLHCHHRNDSASRWAAALPSLMFQRAKSKESVHKLQLLKRKERRDEVESNGVVLLTMWNRLTLQCLVKHQRANFSQTDRQTRQTLLEKDRQTDTETELLRNDADCQTDCNKRKREPSTPYVKSTVSVRDQQHWPFFGGYSMEAHLSSKVRPPQLMGPRPGITVLKLAVCWAAFLNTPSLYLVTHPPLHQVTHAAWVGQQQWTLTPSGLHIATSLTACLTLCSQGLSHTCIHSMDECNWMHMCMCM